MYGVLVFIQILQPCLMGEAIESSSKDFIYNIFSNNWVDVDIGTKKLLLIMTECLKRPIKFSAFGVVNINLETFLEVCRNIYQKLYFHF